MKTTTWKLFAVPIIALSLSACALWETEEEMTPPPSTKSAAVNEDRPGTAINNYTTTPGFESHPLLNGAAPAEKPAVAAAPAPAPVPAATPTPNPVAAAPHHEAVDNGIAATQALQWLKNGNTRFVNNKLRKDGQSFKDIQRLSAGQKPHSIILSCSDSRVPPEIVFDQKLGEVFVVRTAGESLDASALASMEYAVEHLGAKLLVVIGHTSCGAVKAAVSTPPGTSAGSPYLDKLVADIRPRLNLTNDPNRQPAAASKDFAQETHSNAQGVARDLVLRSEIIRRAVESGKLQIQVGIYQMNNGQVQFD